MKIFGTILVVLGCLLLGPFGWVVLGFICLSTAESKKYEEKYTKVENIEEKVDF